MLTLLTVISALVSFTSANSLNVTKEKRGVAGVATEPWLDSGLQQIGVQGWNQQQWNQPLALIASSPLWAEPADFTLGQVQLQAVHNLALQALTNPHHLGTPGIAYSPEVLRTIQYAKEANHQVQLAQHRVAEAKQAAVTQQRIALAQEAGAREAARRSAEIAANAEAEARSSARQLVALQQRLAALKDALAAAQRLAAARENAAAAAIQRSAQDTAAELRKQDVDRQVTQSEREARARDAVAAKENVVSHAGLPNAAQKPIQHNPWG